MLTTGFSCFNLIPTMPPVSCGETSECCISGSAESILNIAGSSASG